MKNTTIIAFIVMLMGSFVSGYFGPWWAPATFIVITSALMGLTVKQSIIISSVALSLVYLGMSIWMSTRDQAGIIEKSGILLGGLSPIVMIIVTTFTGSLTGLFSGWLGWALGRIFKK